MMLYEGCLQILAVQLAYIPVLASLASKPNVGPPGVSGRCQGKGAYPADSLRLTTAAGEALGPGWV
jgi:hypothetical protein